MDPPFEGHCPILVPAVIKIDVFFPECSLCQ